jgi:hypothetical protein
VNGICLNPRFSLSKVKAKSLILGNSSTVELRTLTAIVRAQLQYLSARNLSNGSPRYLDNFAFVSKCFAMSISWPDTSADAE